MVDKCSCLNCTNCNSEVIGHTGLCFECFLSCRFDREYPLDKSTNQRIETFDFISKTKNKSKSKRKHKQNSKKTNKQKTWKTDRKATK